MITAPKSDSLKSKAKDAAFISSVIGFFGMVHIGVLTADCHGFNIRTMSEVIEVSGELYTSQSKETINVEVNWITGCVKFWDRHEKEFANSRMHHDFVFMKRGWMFTDFSVRHLEKSLIYKLTFFNRDGDKVKQLIDATKNQPRWKPLED